MNNKINNKINKINKNHLINPYYYFNCYIYIDEYDKTQKIYQKTNIMNYLLYLKQHLSSLHQEEHIKTYVAKNYFTIPVNDKIDNDNYLYSPYLSSYIIENNSLKEIKDRYLLTDKVILDNGGFSFSERSSFIAKINEEKISLKEISDFLFSKKEIKDLVVFKTKKNELDVINLFYISNIEIENLKEIILKKFNNINYLPKNIMKVENIPINSLGKKDISKIINDYKI
jgi:hypothetical protein